MKTTYAIAAVMLVLFCGFVFSAAGRNGMADNDNAEIRPLDRIENAKDFKERVFERVKKMEIDDAKERIKDALAEKARMEIKSRVENPENEMKLKFRMMGDANFTFAQAAKAKLEQLREKLANAKESGKHAIRDEMRAKAAEVLLAEIDRVLSRLLSLKENENPPQGIDRAIEFFEAKKAELSDVNVSQGTVVKVSKEIRVFWESYNLNAKKDVGHEINEKYMRILEKAKGVSDRLADTIIEMTANGKDTTLLVRAQNKLTLDISKLEDAAAAIRAEYADTNSRRDVKDSLNAAHQLLRASHKQLQKDFILIRLILKATNQLSSGSTISADVAAEIEAVSSETSEEAELEVAQEQLAEVSAEDETNVSIENEADADASSETDEETEVETGNDGDASQEGDVNA